MKALLALCLASCLIILQSDALKRGKYRPRYISMNDEMNWDDDDLQTRPQTIPDPPDHTKLIPMARYVIHNTDWASIATISTQTAIKGFPFSNVKSIVDGPVDNATGIPYFYMSPLDFSAKDLMQNSRATVLVSLQQLDYCEKNNMDPEDPRCTRLMLSGIMKKLKEGTPEYNFAKAALFARHPAMADYPPGHNWFVAKMKIAQIAMIDWFGGANYIPVKDYLAFNYTNFLNIRKRQKSHHDHE